MPYLLIACQVLLAAVFAIALAGKVRGRAAFDAYVSSIVALEILPRRVSVAAANALLAAEAVVIVLLALPWTVPLGFAAAAGTLAAMIGGILVALRRGRRAPCRCFGASVTPLGRVHVVRNLVLAAAGGAGLAAWATAGAGGAGLAAWAVAGPDAPHPAGVVIALVAAGVSALLVVRLDDLMELFAI
ncbi:hypothetical protein SAMN05444920_111168 [Nonomuraea solani]|uniref:Methylamine utilisation protein MauE domain-containing protein n=1 Tax=Nonomuraea solani TaxID=1144553 RepID=A0A1H6EMA7_9ACTN|nr:MauE/DoxX family redox-associated membrane protein [Nonomuraea solani]SEG98045.1 hypothetical protein SAMN05444920_111168 [Nonomuraea solani]